ncbi:AAA family ATPase [Nonomuraea sp. M3C6]|uniref:AAA family ATPase n=1 Tax=Nonomuraea marmarensis TaxID=3351344 RepID=A0ABW7AK55_9ACTN
MKTISHCSEIGTQACRLVVLEGMPGAGKTTIVEKLAAHGCPVLGEYTTGVGATVALQDHPGVDHDDAHQANWTRKAAQARHLLAAHPAVICDRDWLSALAYAYSTGDTALLQRRAIWALEGLKDQRLLLPEVYVVFDLDPVVSLDRRPQATNGHPWSHLHPLHLLRVFYRDPARAVAAHSPVLAELIRSRQRRHLSGHDPRSVNLVAVRAAVAP